MVRMTAAVLALTGLIAVACAGGTNVGRSAATPNPDPYDESPASVIANASIVNVDGSTVGLASLGETRLGVRIEVKVTGLPPGKHGMHIHAIGKCDKPDFASAGPHFNINGRKHGVPGATNAHAGDLPNLVVGPDGKGSLLFYSPHLSLNKAASNGLTFGSGTAIVIHANEDDEKTDPSGNSGGRIACGIVRNPNP